MAMLTVECYAGYRADERPLRFRLWGRTFEIAEVHDRWYAPEATYYRVIAEDGNFYVLKHDERKGEWTLDAFRARESGLSHGRAAGTEPPTLRKN
jgi:hypothetical protein